MDRSYVYNADCYCGDCGDRIIRRLIREGSHPAIRCNNCNFKGEIGRKSARLAFDNRSHSEWLECPKCGDTAAAWDDEDSNTWPAFSSDGTGEADSVMHCGMHALCLNTISLPESGRKPYKIGAWLGNALTSEGIRDITSEIISSRLSGKRNDVLELWAEYYSDCLELAVFSWRLSFVSFCGMTFPLLSTEWSEDPNEGRAEARKDAIAVLRSRVKEAHTVTRIKRTPERTEWECLAPDDASLVPDTAGTLVMYRVQRGSRS